MDAACTYGAAGEPFARYDHDAYGNPTRTLTAATSMLGAATAAPIAGRNVLRYARYANDVHSGLYYLSQRYYDPATCQFTTKDLAKADGEESAYQYCGGDPVGKVDPSGEYEQTIWSTRVPTYKILWWAKGEAFFVLLGGSISKSLGRCVWRRCSTRLAANYTSKMAKLLLKPVLSTLKRTIKASFLTRAADWGEQYTTGWAITRSEVRIQVFRETSQKAYFARAGLWALKKPGQPAKGFAEYLGIGPVSLVTDDTVNSLIKDWAYLQSAR